MFLLKQVPATDIGIIYHINFAIKFLQILSVPVDLTAIKFLQILSVPVDLPVNLPVDLPVDLTGEFFYYIKYFLYKLY